MFWSLPQLLGYLEAIPALSEPRQDKKADLTGLVMATEEMAVSFNRICACQQEEGHEIAFLPSFLPYCNSMPFR